ncbi:MAG: phosphatidylserine decarboxylase [Rickettsiales bacterium]|nr:phosphatidylserine decarboxylase [Rickettsiales bacterium]
MIDSIRKAIHPIHKEGYIFVAIAFVITVMISFLGIEVLTFISAILTVWCYYFFRDPARVVPDIEDAVISPADGLVQMITVTSPPEELGMEEGVELTRISIFLNVFNVHVNRIPMAGTVKQLYYHPGKFFNAELDKASIHNERQTCVVTAKNDKDVIFVQIAGLIARRIVCDLSDKQEVAAGERYGIIRFGSRVDVYLPEGVEPQVAVGQQAIGGETVLARLDSKAEALVGIKK